MNTHRLVVVADAHFASVPNEGPDDEAVFLDFLQRVPKVGDTLLLAGDIYDFWFSYRHVIPRRNFAVTAALTQLAQRIPVMMVGGNHDRWGGTFWDSFPGMRFDPMQLQFRAANRSVLAIHGDGLHETTWGHRVLNQLIRSRLAIGTFRRLPPDLGIPLGHRLGHDGQHAAHEVHVAAAASRQHAWAVKRLAADPTVQLLVMGHTHAAAVAETAPNQWYLNPGPWLQQHCYAVVDQDGPQLERFS